MVVLFLLETQLLMLQLKIMFLKGAVLLAPFFYVTGLELSFRCLYLQTEVNLSTMQLQLILLISPVEKQFFRDV